MTPQTESRQGRVQFPNGSWYAAVTSEALGRSPVGTTVLGERIALYRDGRGGPVALKDRCAHSSYPLSRGTVDGDRIRCGYSGFVYGPDGKVVSVPTQPQIPFDAAVRAYPTKEADGFVWVWLGTPGRAALRQVPALPWLTSPEWTTFGDTATVEAHASLFQDNFADITHITHLDPTTAPPVLADNPPPLEVTVSEMSVRFSRDFGAAPLQPWQAEVLELPVDSTHEQREEGAFVAPGLWIDRWDISVTGHGDQDGAKTLYFTHAITPVDEHTTTHTWRVSRNFSSSPAATGTMEPQLREYYDRVHSALELIEDAITHDGPAHEVTVASDAAKVAVRKIMRRIVAEEGASERR